MSRSLVPRLGLLLFAWAAASSLTYAATISYDNTATPTSGDWAPKGFWAFSAYTPNEPTGDEVGLGGTDRFVRQFDLLLSSTGPAAVSSVTLDFYLPDGLDGNGYLGAPGTLLWSGTAYNVLVNGPTTLAFPVPSILVPDDFIWIVRADSKVAGLATFNPPTIGSSGVYFWDRDPFDGQWYALLFGDVPNPVANFGARIWAVPEPATGLLLAAGLFCLRRRKWRGRLVREFRGHLARAFAGVLRALAPAELADKMSAPRRGRATPCESAVPVSCGHPEKAQVGWSLDVRPTLPGG